MTPQEISGPSFLRVNSQPGCVLLTTVLIENTSDNYEIVKFGRHVNGLWSKTSNYFYLFLIQKSRMFIFPFDSSSLFDLVLLQA